MFYKVCYYIIQPVKNLSRIIISVALIFAFSSALIFCCAFEEARVSTLEHCDHDQSDKADHQHDSHSSHDCMCQQTFIADFSKSFSLQPVSAHLFNKFLKDTMVLGHSFNPAPLSQATFLADRSPPLFAIASVPIYLKNSNLRI